MARCDAQGQSQSQRYEETRRESPTPIARHKLAQPAKFLLDIKSGLLFHHGMPNYVTGKVFFGRMAKWRLIVGCRCCWTFARAAGGRGAQLSLAQAFECQ